MKEGFERQGRKNEVPKGALAADVQHVLMGLRAELQKKRATESFVAAHPDREVDLSDPGTRNEIMTEWVGSGEAAKFAEEFGGYDQEKLRQALLGLDAPNMPSQEETQH
jgi:hypothetical protein